LKLYPEEWIGNINLGILYNDLEQWDKAIEHFEINKQDQTAYYFSSLYLAQSYAATGRYNEAEEVLEYYLNNYSDNATVRWYLAQNYIYEGKYDLALIEADKASSLNPGWYYNFLLKGDIYHLKGDLEKSEQEYHKLLESEEHAGQMYGRLGLAALYLSRGRFMDSISHINQACKMAKKLGDKSSEFNFLRYLASMYVKSGNPEEALKIIEKAWQIVVETQDLTQKKSYIYDKAVIYFEMKMVKESMKEAEELKRMVLEGINQKEIRYYYYLVGAQALEIEDFSKAVKYLKKALSLMSYQYASNNEHALFIDALASAYFKAADLEKAQTEYERILSLTIARLYYGDIYANSFYMLGKIYEQQGDTANAIEHYEKFLNLWKDADPGVAEVENAKKRLAGLRQ
jgi:tetratricopeptide (TPR) repeat protein